MIMISVVIPTFKRQALLAACLQALCNQTLDGNCFEVIVVADGKDALTENVVNDFTASLKHIRFFSLPENRGPAAVRNLGWRNANSALIAFTDDDCMPDNGWLQAYVNAYLADQTYNAFTGCVRVPVPAIPTDYERNVSGLATADFVTANCCCTKNALILCEGFDERYRIAWREDSDLHFKLLSNNIRLRKIEGAVVTHPARPAPWGISLKEQKKGIYNALLYKKFPSFYRRYIQQRPVWSYYLAVFFCMSVFAGLVYNLQWLYVTGLTAFACLAGIFMKKRLHGTSHKWSHVAEMLFTSMLIPFLSLYWHFYGAIKYRVLFL